MKIVKILGGLFGVLLVAVAVVWAMFIKAPSVEDQCAHARGLMEAELEGFGDSPMAKEFDAQCPDNMKKGKRQGAVPYAKQAKCVMAATTMAELDDC